MTSFKFAVLGTMLALAWPGMAQSTGDITQSQLQQLLQQQTGANQQQTVNIPGSNSGMPNIPGLIPGRVTSPNISNMQPELTGTQAEQTGAQLEYQQRLALMQLAPEPDLEFQQFVAAAIGAKLPIFGHNLFESAPSTFAPLDRVQVTPDYLIAPGDELVVRAWGQIDVNWRATVDRSGEIYIPKIGTINVAGVRYADLHDVLQSQIGKVFKNFELSVSMGRLRSIQVFVIGQARRPGSYTVSSLSSLVDALFASGGPSNRGSMRTIYLKRDLKTISTFDIYDLLTNGDKSHDVPLLPGDVIYIPPVGPLVALAGSVNTPAIYELKGHETLADAVRASGGLSNTAAGQHVVVERIENRQVRVTDDFLLTKDGFSRELHDGDVVRFLHVSPKFDNTVTLRGNVAVPGLYPWHENMRVRDLIPSRDALVTEDYWSRQNQLSVPAQMSESHVNQEALKNDVSRLSTEINWDYAVIQRLDTSDLSPHLLPFNLGKAIEGDEAANLPLQPNDVVTIFSRTDIQVPLAKQSKFVHLEGEVARAGIYQVQPGETLRQLLERTGGFTPQAYLYGAEFTRESTRVAQQLRLDEYIANLDQSIRQGATTLAAAGQTPTAAAERAASESTVNRLRALRATGRIVLEVKPNEGGAAAVPDLALEDGDRFIVPFKPATVNVIGAVYNSNAFLYRRGATVGDYLRLAGGPTRAGDKGREFVIRADGSTVSRQQHNRFMSHDFLALRLMPGDTVVVPQRLPRGAGLTILRDYTSILSQFGIAAAGIGTII